MPKIKRKWKKKIRQRPRNKPPTKRTKIIATSTRKENRLFKKSRRFQSK
jgi:hypothetical protein